ncbi:MAG: hypothetical protein IK117_12300 [Bacteroidales bacterium]|nr:hypothetical protein [Bacteroidales bacterium]
MKKVVFGMLCASVCFGFLATSCSKDEEENSIDPKNVTKSDSDGYGSAISVIQNQIIGTDWYLEYKTGTDDYNNSAIKHSVYYNFTESEIFEIDAASGNKIKRCTYTTFGDTAIAYNDLVLCYAPIVENVILSNDTLYFGYSKEQISGYFVKKEIVDNSEVQF